VVTRKKETVVTDPKNNQQTPDEKTVVPNHDELEVKAALQRTTQDGKGEGAVPESDFKSFATEGVEKDATSNPADLAREVLEGTWGYSRRSALRNLRNKGHDVNAVDDELQKLLDSGAPSTLVP
jgi:hypothetical protein